MTNAKRWCRRAWKIATSLPGLAATAATLIGAATPIVLSGIQDVSGSVGYDAGWVTDAVTRWSVTAVAVLTIAGNVYRRVVTVGRELWSIDPIDTITSVVIPEGPAGP